MAHGVNVFNGDMFRRRPTMGMWEYTYKENKHFSAPHNWAVPDQIYQVPYTTLECNEGSLVSEVFSANSMEHIESTSFDVKTGYKHEVKLSAGAKISGVDVKAETTRKTSLNFGISQDQGTSERNLKEGYKYSMTK